MYNLPKAYQCQFKKVDHAYLFTSFLFQFPTEITVIFTKEKLFSYSAENDHEKHKETSDFDKF